MGIVTDSMARLRAEFLAGRHGREAFRRELAQATRARQIRVFELRSAFAQDLAGARRAWQDRAPAEAPPEVPAPPPILAASPAVPARKNKRKRRLKH